MRSISVQHVSKTINQTYTVRRWAIESDNGQQQIPIRAATAIRSRKFTRVINRWSLEIWRANQHFTILIRSDSLRALEVLVICSICQNRLRSPRMLQCQHTFCLACLEALVQQHEQKSRLIQMGCFKNWKLFFSTNNQNCARLHYLFYMQRKARTDVRFRSGDRFATKFIHRFGAAGLEPRPNLIKPEHAFHGSCCCCNWKGMCHLEKSELITRWHHFSIILKNLVSIPKEEVHLSCYKCATIGNIRMQNCGHCKQVRWAIFPRYSFICL